MLRTTPPIRSVCWSIQRQSSEPCKKRARRVLRKAPRRSARSVIVVPDDDYDLYRHLVAAFAPIPDILVLLDRRRSDRRRVDIDVAVERRNSHRRARPLRPLMETVRVLLG